MDIIFAHYRNRFCMFRTYYALAIGAVKMDGINMNVIEMPDPPSREQEEALINGDVQAGNLYLPNFIQRKLQGAPIVGLCTEWKSTMTVAYDSDSFTAQVRWNYSSKLEEDVGLGNLPGFGNTNPTRPALSYFDLSLRKKIGSNFELTGIVSNILNAKARVTVGGLGDQGGVDTTYYNPVILGRYFRISAKVKM